MKSFFFPLLVIGILGISVLCHAVQVDGYCFLENQQNHEGTSILFLADSPSAETDSTHTDSTGYYQIDLTNGEYDVDYTRESFVTYTLNNLSVYSPITLPEMILYVMPLGIHISGSISGALVDTIYIAESNLYVQDGDSLIIEPGATIHFFKRAADEGQFRIRGYLYAVGTEMDSIKFLPISPITYWGGIGFHEGFPDSTSIMEYCFIKGSFSSGISFTHSSATIIHCTVTGDSAYRGGGIWCSEGNPTINYCVITNCKADLVGGAFYLRSNSRPTISNCTITNNTAPTGGGIYCTTGSSPFIYNCTISGNSGGGIYCQDAANPTIVNCYISDDSQMGIACIDSSNPEIINCTISGNTLQGILCDNRSNATIINSNIYGNMHGGITCLNSSNPIIDHCIIHRNFANEGGGILCNSSNPNIINSTIVGNSVIYQGGAICSYYSDLVVLNSIIAYNNGDGGCFIYNSPNASLQFNDFFNNEGGNFTGTPPTNLGVINSVNANGDSCDIFSNIFLEPQMVNPDSGDYHLQSTSPCIDAGDPASPLDPDSTIADIGAFFFDQAGINDPREIPQPTEFRLSQNYPNPFNATTVIPFQLPHASHITLSVYDVLGRKVATPIDNPLSSGYHTAAFDASDLASGIYFCQMQANDFMEVKKMILLK